MGIRLLTFFLTAFLFFKESFVSSSLAQTPPTAQFHSFNASAKSVSIAQNTNNKTFLVIFDDNNSPNYGVKNPPYQAEDADNKVYAQFVDINGNPIGAPKLISSPPEQGGRQKLDRETPNVVYNSKRNEYVVFYNEISRSMPEETIADSEQYRNTCYDIIAVRVDITGNKVGNQLVVSDATDCQWQPVASYDPDFDRFFVIWHDFRNAPEYPDRPSTSIPKEGKDIYGRFVGYDSSENLKNDGPEILVSFNASNRDSPAFGYQDWEGIVYNPYTKEFITLWSDERDQPLRENSSVRNNCGYTVWERSKKFQIYGQIIKPDGTMTGNNFPLFNKVTGDGGGRHEKPNVTYNNISKKYLATFVQQDLPTTSPCPSSIPQGGSAYFQSFSVTSSGATTANLTNWPKTLTDLGNRKAYSLTQNAVSGFYPYADIGCKKEGNGNCLLVWSSGNAGSRKLTASYTDSNGNRLSSIFDLFTSGDAKMPKVLSTNVFDQNYFVIAFVNHGEAYTGMINDYDSGGITGTPPPASTNTPAPSTQTTITERGGTVNYDINNDNQINQEDLNEFIPHFASHDQTEDFNRDGSVNLLDFELLRTAILGL